MNTQLRMVLYSSLLILASCGEQRQAIGPAASPPSAPSNTAEASASADDQRSAAVAQALLGLVQDAHVHPERNAVDAFAAAFGWKAIPTEMNALMNAKSGYVGTLGGKRAMLGSDGTNDVIALTIPEGFSPTAIISSLQGIATLTPKGSDSSFGQTMDVYVLRTGGEDIGILSLTYGTADAVRGVGTIAFMSARKAQSEGLWR